MKAKAHSANNGRGWELKLSSWLLCGSSWILHKVASLNKEQKQQGRRVKGLCWVLQHLEGQPTTGEDQPVKCAENRERPCSLSQDQKKSSENRLFTIVTLEGIQWLLLTRLSTWLNFNPPASSATPSHMLYDHTGHIHFPRYYRCY